MDAALAHGLLRNRSERIGPADWVTLARATLAVGVAALVADSFGGSAQVAALVTLAAVALALDFVDGYVARRTGTASTLGARWDGEVDAFLILVLAVYVASSVGAWVLRSAWHATRSWSQVTWSSGCARRCPGATGARSSRRRRGSC